LIEQARNGVWVKNHYRHIIGVLSEALTRITLLDFEKSGSFAQAV